MEQSKPPETNSKEIDKKIDIYEYLFLIDMIKNSN
jgi:hypothetical protein